MPASRKARAIIFAPRSCPSSPGFAMSTRILFSGIRFRILSLLAFLCALGVLCVKRFSALNNKSSHTILQNSHIEVDQKPDPVSRQSQVRQNNSLVNGCQTFDGLQLNNDSAFHKDINPVAAL